MKFNILQAILNIINNNTYDLVEYYKSKNRINIMGESLEEYIKDIFSNSYKNISDKDRNQNLQSAFSYLGNQNNPPDIILRGGDAIEVKKIETINSYLALNSSYPKAKLFSNSNMLTEACKNCEDWNIKDIIYAVGVVKKMKISSLFFVYGVDYAASANIYERIKDIMCEGINSIQDIEFSKTNELGRVNRVDPLGITYLRIRGMWHIQNPINAFRYIHNNDNTYEFNLTAIINNEKYNSFDKEIRDNFERAASLIKNFNIEEVEIKIPDNPALLRKAKLITYKK